MALTWVNLSMRVFTWATIMSLRSLDFVSKPNEMLIVSDQYPVRPVYIKTISLKIKEAKW